MGLSHLAFHIGNAEMGTSHVLFLGQAGFVLLDLRQVHQSLLEDLVAGIEQPLFPFRVGRRDGPVESREEYETGLAALSLRGHFQHLPQDGRRPAGISIRTSISLPTVDQPRIILKTSL